MALKTSNYKVAETGAILPNAVALVTHLDTVNNKAVLSIAESRESALKGIAVKKIEIECVFDRNGDMLKQAYESATQPKMVKMVDQKSGEEKECKVLPYFYNWENDIIEN